MCTVRVAPGRLTLDVCPASDFVGDVHAARLKPIHPSTTAILRRARSSPAATTKLEQTERGRKSVGLTRRHAWRAPRRGAARGAIASTSTAFRGPARASSMSASMTACLGSGRR